MSYFKNVLVVTDNGLLLDRFIRIVENAHVDSHFTYRRSFASQKFKAYEGVIASLPEIDVKRQANEIIDKYDLVISLHCKQIFPAVLVDSRKCINIHPGYNPINRGWYPQVFAIINSSTIGATIHEMDADIDNGKIIDRMRVDIRAEDTSKEVYERVLEAEMVLWEKNINRILANQYNAFKPESQGVYHTRKDFESLCKLDLDEQLTMRQAIDRLRALTHGAYRNCYYEMGRGRIFVSISLSKEQELVMQHERGNV